MLPRKVPGSPEPEGSSQIIESVGGTIGGVAFLDRCNKSQACSRSESARQQASTITCEDFADNAKADDRDGSSRHDGGHRLGDLAVGLGDLFHVQAIVPCSPDGEAAATAGGDGAARSRRRDHLRPAGSRPSIWRRSPSRGRLNHYAR